MSICVDASLVIRLVADPTDARITVLWETWARDGQMVLAPTLLFYEVANALHRYQRAGHLTAAAVALAVDAALALPIHLHGDAALHREAFALASRLGLPATYDAHYLALAARFGAIFWTADARLVHTVTPALPWVRLLPY